MASQAVGERRMAEKEVYLSVHISTKIEDLVNTDYQAKRQNVTDYTDVSPGQKVARTQHFAGMVTYLAVDGVSDGQHRERDMDGDDVDRQRQPWAVRFSLTMHALNPGVQIGFRWLTRIAVLVAVWRTPEVMSWLR